MKEMALPGTKQAYDETAAFAAVMSCIRTDSCDARYGYHHVSPLVSEKELCTDISGAHGVSRGRFEIERRKEVATSSIQGAPTNVSQ
jgi:hypothetical protein